MQKREIRKMMGSGIYPRFYRASPDDSRWKTLIPVGHLGVSRNEFCNRMDSTFGIDMWRLAHYFKGYFIDYIEVCKLYQKSYAAYLQKRMDLVEKLVMIAGQICAEDASDLVSGLDYFEQNGERTQILAIALRNVLVDMGLELRGREIVYLRGPKTAHSFCEELQPETVPFIYPEEIVKPWHEENKEVFSVEHFYIHNRYLQVWRGWWHGREEASDIAREKFPQKSDG